jgi:hypothetical protein
MHIRRTVVALFLGMSLSVAGAADADTSAGTGATKKEPGKGKRGDACKSSSDCDQSSGPTSCVNSKCQAERVPPPVT